MSAVAQHVFDDGVLVVVADGATVIVVAVAVGGRRLGAVRAELSPGDADYRRAVTASGSGRGARRAAERLFHSLTGDGAPNGKPT